MSEEIREWHWVVTMKNGVKITINVYDVPKSSMVTYREGAFKAMVNGDVMGLENSVFDFKEVASIVYYPYHANE